MVVILYLGIFWTLYGIAGLFGIQNIPKKYRDKKWSKEYCRASGKSWLLIGVPWILLYLASSYIKYNWLLMTLMVVFAVPSVLYGYKTELIFKARLNEENKPGRSKKKK